jgi:PAS domain S-box-containing protein
MLRTGFANGVGEKQGTPDIVIKSRRAERKEAEKHLEQLAQLRLSEATKQAAILDALPAHIALLDTRGMIISVNQAWRDFADANALQGPEYVIGLSYLDICDSAQGDSSAEAHQAATGIRSVLDGVAKSFSIEYPCHSPTEHRWFLLTVTPLSDDHPAGAVVMHLNISERKNADQKFMNLLESAPDAMVLVDRDGRLDLVNSQTVKLFGWPREQLLGQTIQCLMPERFRDQHPSIHSSFLVRPGARAMAGGVELFGVHRDGTEFPVEISLSPVETHEGTLVMGAIRDITERKQAQAQILRLNAELEDRVEQRTAQLQTANEELQAFAYSVSHDLRAPLSSIAGFSGLLNREIGSGEASPRAKHCLARIGAGVVQMSELIDSFLKLAKLSRTSVRWDSVDLSAMAQTVLNGYKESEPGRLAQLAIEPGLLVQGDAQLLRQVLENLLGNAWKFTRQQQTAHIAFRREITPDGQAVYAVQDNGIGFDMASSEKIFVAFQRLHTVEEFAGSGIGLATVHKIITRHGGRVWAESSLGSGATFFFTLGTATLENPTIKVRTQP